MSVVSAEDFVKAVENSVSGIASPFAPQRAHCWCQGIGIVSLQADQDIAGDLLNELGLDLGDGLKPLNEGAKAAIVVL